MLVLVPVTSLGCAYKYASILWLKTEVGPFEF